LGLGILAAGFFFAGDFFDAMEHLKEKAPPA
jgi:hypothetical protein